MFTHKTLQFSYFARMEESSMFGNHGHVAVKVATMHVTLIHRVAHYAHTQMNYECVPNTFLIFRTL